MPVKVKRYAIAIDGPCAAGKTTTARKMAEEFGYVYVDTGAIYRTLALACIDNKVDCEDEVRTSRLLERININISYSRGGAQVMTLDGYDVTDMIRTPEISIAASKVAAHSEVRDQLVMFQRDIAKNNDVIMEGRDIGTVILPMADLKIYLTASERVRATRRLKELVDKGAHTDYDHVLATIQYRDSKDSRRDNAPLKCARGAIRLDNSDMTIEETFAEVRKLIDKIHTIDIIEAEYP